MVSRRVMYGSSRTMTPSIIRSPSWNSGLFFIPSPSRARASRFAATISESVFRSRKARIPANITKYSRPSSVM